MKRRRRSRTLPECTCVEAPGPTNDYTHDADCPRRFETRDERERGDDDGIEYADPRDYRNGYE